MGSRFIRNHCSCLALGAGGCSGCHNSGATGFSYLLLVFDFGTVVAQQAHDLVFNFFRPRRRPAGQILEHFLEAERAWRARWSRWRAQRG